MQKLEDGQFYIERAMELLVLQAMDPPLAPEERKRFFERDPKAYLNEVATVRISGPRRAGHSYAIRNLMWSFSNEGISSWVVTPAKCRQIDTQDIVAHQVAWLGKKVSGDPRPSGPAHLLFVDNATFLTKGERERIERYAIERLEINVPAYFVLVYVQ